MKEIKLDVEGIMCGNCVKKITKIVMGQEGVKDVAVSDDFKLVSVVFEEDKITANNIKAVIEEIEGTSFKIIH